MVASLILKRKLLKVSLPREVLVFNSMQFLFLWVYWKTKSSVLIFLDIFPTLSPQIVNLPKYDVYPAPCLVRLCLSTFESLFKINCSYYMRMSKICKSVFYQIFGATFCKASALSPWYLITMPMVLILYVWNFNFALVGRRIRKSKNLHQSFASKLWAQN